jgi:hypothetical protein
MALSRSNGGHISCTLSSPAITSEAQARNILQKNRRTSMATSPTPWLWGAINRQQAEHALRSEKEGSFLIRDKKDDYALSINTGVGEFEHHQLSLCPDGAFAINGEKLEACNSLQQVVEELSRPSLHISVNLGQGISPKSAGVDMPMPPPPSALVPASGAQMYGVVNRRGGKVTAQQMDDQARAHNAANEINEGNDLLAKLRASRARSISAYPEGAEMPDNEAWDDSASVGSVSKLSMV